MKEEKNPKKRSDQPKQRCKYTHTNHICAETERLQQCLKEDIMNEKALKTLEYDKIITKLAEYAQTPIGIRMCRELLPMDQIDRIRTAQQETSDAQNRVRLKGSISFSGARDLGASIKRLQIGSALNLTELLHISSLLDCAARAKNYGRQENEESQGDSLSPLFSAVEPLTPLNTEIKRCILSEEEVSDDASPKLRQIRRSIRLTGDRVHTQLNSLVNTHRTYLQDAVITMRNGRYCIPVKAEYKSQVSGMVHDQSSSGSTFFIEPMAIVKLNNELRELELAEQKEIDVILAGLSQQAAEYADMLLENIAVLSQLDFIFAKAALARHYKGTEPLFNENRYVEIKSGRHPLLDPARVVPVDLTIGGNFDLLIVTGPNTGGKTVSLKTLGLLQLMGQAGLHIPAFEGSKLAVFPEIFADIGDEQSIEQSLSTFSSHMTNIVRILEQADTDSLVLFDELGGGTDPVEGAALAMSILTWLHKMGIRTMATTHYSELKVFALSTPGVENASCEFQVETLQPTYRLLMGIPGKSNAFAISRKLGLPEHLIEDASAFIGKQEKDFEDVIAELDASREALAKEQEETARYREEARRLKERLQTRQEQFDKRREEMLAKAREEAMQIVLEAKSTADRTIKNINKLGADSDLGRALEEQRAQLRGEISKLEAKAAKKQQKPRKVHKAEEFKIGDAVRVVSLNLNGTVSSLPNAKGDLFVQMGILRSQVNIKDLELIPEATITGPAGDVARRSKKGSGASQIKMSKSFQVSSEINLIGMTTDEAVAQLDKYLDDAYLAHLAQVRVVHGRGTGALKKAVHQHLKRLKYVKSYRLGTFGEGDTGVTIVDFAQ